MRGNGDARLNYLNAVKAANRGEFGLLNEFSLL